MSLWINRYRCNRCGSEMNVQGGVVGTTHMGPQSDVPCPNHNCSAVWGRNTNDFENLGPIDHMNPEQARTLVRHLDNGHGD